MENNMPDFVMSKKGNDVLSMILDWEITQNIMREEDDKFVRAKELVDGYDYILFFICRGSIYGANETSRSVFSVMKNPMDEPGYEEMSFSASNLSKAMKGDPKEEIFIYKDIDCIKVINKDVARHMLMKHKKGKEDSEVSNKMRNLNFHKDQRSKDGRIKLTKDFEAFQ
jgi:hypothetical protein